MILLDTNVLSELTKPAPSERVADWLAENEQRLALSAVTMAELRFGIARLPEGARKTSLLRFWQSTKEHFKGRIFAFDERAAEVYGDMAAAAERKGRRLKIADAQIAATAMVHKMTVATRDYRDFEASGIPLVNPWG
ncbi:MAG: type II toxin-antitoxin system VapC family toxin [Halieaceae bacterium]|nr:type II toxin-antitoxin system VapC family toxin [Halieaceae bacterium]